MPGLLKGAAKLAVESSNEIHSWTDLKESLKKEFGDTPTSLSLHRALEARKKNSGETLLEYLYLMKAIVNRGNVDDSSLIAYIISGIPDETVNKVMLYDASNLDELKHKLKVYQTMKEQQKAKKVNKSDHRPPYEKGHADQARTRCTNCGSKSHWSSRCPHKVKCSRCFNCSEFGHIAPNCPQRREKGSSQENRGQSSINIVSVPDLHTKVIIENREYVALVDTGSDVTLIKESTAGSLPLSRSNLGPSISLTGFGKEVKRTLASFVSNLKIGNEDYGVRCHIVSDEWISQDILLGNDVLREATLILRNGKVSIKKTQSRTVKEDGSFLEKLDVMYLVEETKVNQLEDIENKMFREEVKELIESYNPMKPMKPCIEMTICLEDNTPSPIYQKPRRLALRRKN